MSSHSNNSWPRLHARKTFLFLLLVGSGALWVMMDRVWAPSPSVEPGQPPVKQAVAPVAARQESLPEASASRGLPQGAALPSAAPVVSDFPASRPHDAGLAISHPAFAQSKDLWKLAVDASASDDPDRLREGMAAARECVPLLDAQDELRVRIQSDPASRLDRETALAALLDRCRGFANPDRVRVRHTVDQLRKRHAAAAAQARPAQDNPPDILRRLRTGQAPDASEALVGLAHTILAQAADGERLPVDERRADLLMVAVLGAACQFGKDCSPTAFETLLQCVMVAACGPHLFSDRDPSLTDSEWNLVQVFRQEMARAVKSGSLDGIVAVLKQR